MIKSKQNRNFKAANKHNSETINKSWWNDVVPQKIEFVEYVAEENDNDSDDYKYPWEK